MSDLTAPKIERATTLEDAIYLLNPQKPLEGDSLAYYVDRGSMARRNIQTILRTNDLQRGEPVRILFSGHTGCGKSTELNKLCEELAGSFFVVKVSTSKIVQPTDLTYVDVVLIAAMELFRAATAQEVVSKAPAQRLSEIWDDLADFIRKRVFGHLPYRAPAESPEVTATVSALVFEFETKYKSEASSRDQIRSQMESRLSEIIERINTLALLVRQSTQRPVLFVFDDTDKPDPERGRALFFDHPTTLTSFQTSAIYTFNIALWYNREFKTFRDYFGGRYLLPNIKLFHRNESPAEEGRLLLNAIVERRIQPDLIAADALEQMVVASGGLVRSLISLGQFAAVNALGRGAQRIETQDVARAIVELRNDFIASLRKEEYAMLAELRRTKQLAADEEVQDLLQTVALLQYENGEVWCDVHPVVVELLRERGLLA